MKRLCFALFVSALPGLSFCQSAAPASVHCVVAPAVTPTEAQRAFLDSNYEKAATLYQGQLQGRPDDPSLTKEYSLVLLRQQKVHEADILVHKALGQHPKSVELLTALGEVQYREGTPWLAVATMNDAMTIDPCYAPLRLLGAKLYRLSSYYGVAANEVKTAYKLDPHDPGIRREWLRTLPLKKRIAEMESYLASGSGEDEETKKNLGLYLDFLKHQLTDPHRSCRMVSEVDSATVPFALILHDATRIRAFGLEVKLNGHNSRLQLDTGASGLIVSRTVAEHAGLKQFSKTEISGIGSKGGRQGYTAYADDIRIGPLEFRDCEVDVIDQGNVVDVDGLIGADVFSHFLVTLDYPMRKLQLAPLPKRPDEVVAAKPALETAGNEGNEEAPAETSEKKEPVSSGPRNRYVAPEMKDWTPIYRIGHYLLIPAALNNTAKKLFILDTGAFATTISPETAREVTKVHNDNDMTVKGISGKVDKVFVADKITFRFAHLSQQVQDVVSFSTDSMSKSVGMDVSGLIGITALGYLKIDIDYRDGLMNLTYDANRGYNR
ncbi:MAG TPA: aspartyl protease family protein [Edaphobacter sp.]|nr:aspartyl protease family protein [Edaphobacter sp.]